MTAYAWLTPQRPRTGLAQWECKSWTMRQEQGGVQLGCSWLSPAGQRLPFAELSNLAEQNEERLLDLEEAQNSSKTSILKRFL